MKEKVDIGGDYEAMKYNADQYFDLFGLIEAGLALDKNTLK